MSGQQTTNYDSSAENKAETTDSGVLDQRYYRGPLGILKFCEMGFSLIGFICVTASLVVCVPWVATTGYFNFITMAAFITTLILYVVLLFKLQRRVLTCACINWSIVMLSYYSGVVVLLFFGDLFLSLQECHIAHQVGVAFGWFALGAYIVDLVLAALAFRNERSSSGQSQQSENRY